MSAQLPDDIKRWTAKRRTALVQKNSRRRIARSRMGCSSASSGPSRRSASGSNFKTFEEAKETLSTWIEFYNNQRPHQALGYQSPAERRAQHQLNVA